MDNRLSAIRKVLGDVNLSKSEKTKFLIAISTLSDSRRMLWIKGKGKMLSHVVWNLYHPDDKVKAGEHVHHKNEDTLDDEIGNYEKLSNARHAKKHYEEVKKDHGGVHPMHLPETREKASAKVKGRAYSKERIEKAAAGNRGRKHTKEACLNMSLAHVGNFPSENTKTKMAEAQQKRRAGSMKWDPKEALQLKADGLFKREIASKLGVDPNAISSYFKLRGIPY